MKTDKEKTEEPEPNDYHNPLWIVVGGMAWLFGVLLVILAFSGTS